MTALDTSALALKAMAPHKLAKQAQEIFDVVLGAQRNGTADMSLTEIRDAYERRHHKRIDVNRVSARVSELVAAKRLARKPDTRFCSVTQRAVHPVYVPPTQERLVP